MSLCSVSGPPLAQPCSARPVSGASPVATDGWSLSPLRIAHGLILLQQYCDPQLRNSTQNLYFCFAELFVPRKTMSRPIGFFLTTAFPIVPLARAIPSLRSFSTLGGTLLKNLPPRPKPPPDSEIEESYLKGSGPGGQKIVRTDTQRSIQFSAAQESLFTRRRNIYTSPSARTKPIPQSNSSTSPPASS